MKKKINKTKTILWETGKIDKSLPQILRKKKITTIKNEKKEIIIDALDNKKIRKYYEKFCSTK